VLESNDGRDQGTRPDDCADGVGRERGSFVENILEMTPNKKSENKISGQVWVMAMQEKMEE
jgi:hypothetical protein